MTSKILLLFIFSSSVSFMEATSINHQNYTYAGGYGSDVYKSDDFQRRSGKISVGTPAKTYRVAYELNSPDFWLISPNVIFRWDTKPKVAYESSSTVPLPMAYNATTTEAAGATVLDNLTVAGVKIIKKVRFGVASSGIPGYYDYAGCYFGNCNFDVDGFFGLSPKRGGALQQLTYRLAEPIVTIHNKKLYRDEGTITFGAVDTQNCNESDYSEFVPLAEPRDKWATNLLAVRVGNQTLNITANKLQVVDGYEWMNVPAADLKAVGEAMGAVPYSEHSNNLYDRPKYKADIVLTIGDKLGGRTAEVVLKDPVYMYGKRLIRMVGTNLDGGENPDTWYFTLPYLASQCTAVNFKEGTIAFAPIKDLSTYNLSG